MQNPSLSEPILVKNPNTGKLINLNPLFSTAFQLSDGKDFMLKNIKNKIDYAIRYLSTNEFRDDHFLSGCTKELVHDLYEIVDMFDEMENF